MFLRKYILGTLFGCIATIVAVIGLGFLIGYENIQGRTLHIFRFILMAALGIGWLSLMVILASRAMGPYLRTLSEEKMLKLNIPMMIFCDHIPKRDVEHGD